MKQLKYLEINFQNLILYTNQVSLEWLSGFGPRKKLEELKIYHSCDKALMTSKSIKFLSSLKSLEFRCRTYKNFESINRSLGAFL